jgi:hypothetical protein
VSASIAIAAAAGLAALGLARGRGSRKLEGFERIGKLPRPSQVHPVSRSIYSPRAEEVYAERLKTARLPLYIVLGGEDPEDDHWLWNLERRAEEIAKQGYAVLLLTMPLEKYVESVLLRANPYRMMGEEGRVKALQRAQELLDGKDPARKISPMTPFSLLHRMGDEMHNNLRWSWPIKETLEPYARFLYTYSRKSERELLDLGSAGVNTWAGRNGLLHMPEMVSDLWAKYVLTGRIDFDPKAPPQSTKRYRGWLAQEQKVRDDTYEKISEIFPLLLERAKGNVVKIT